MKRILFLFIIATFAFSETILIPEDYATIQEGIDASVDGDTVLVADGNYFENLVLNKSIVLASYAIYDNLDDWITYDDVFYEQWVINNSHIANTRLIGSNPDDPDYGSVILITPDSNECIYPEIVGFTIQGGSGTRVLRDDTSVVLGGGILADVSDPYIHHNAFIDNGSDQMYSGGASQLTSGAEDWSFDNRFENYNPRCDVQEFRLSNNLYDGNDAQYGNSVANRYHEDEFDMSGSIFDVYNCGGGEGNEVSSVWVKVEPDASVDYSASEGNACAFTAPNVYVDPNIGQECLDEGCGFQFNPFKTITRALDMIMPSEDNPTTIHLAAGTYSPETGENFPIIMISNVNLIGENEETTIIDAMQTASVIHIADADNNIISGITITGGLADGEFPYDRGAGMNLFNSSPTLTDVTIAYNTAATHGGGMLLSASHPILTNVTIEHNTAVSLYGGGMRLFHSHPILTDVIIKNNTARYGGGIVLYWSNATLKDVIIEYNTAHNSGGIEVSYSSPKLTDVMIAYNSAESEGGGMSIKHSYPTIENVTIAYNTSDYRGGGIYLDASEPILNHVMITNNIANNYGGGIYSYNSSPILSHATIVNNTANSSGGGMNLSNSAPIIENSIIWGNNPESIFVYQGDQPIITYSDIEGGWEGEGNIDINPLFVNSEGGDYTLQEGSSCIDACDDSNVWYSDLDGTQADMGATGGLFITPNFISKDFGYIGGLGSHTDFTLYNYRQTSITINNINFETTSFSSNTSFPMIIEPFETGTINIEANNNSLGYVEDAMEIISEDLPDGISVSLSVIGEEGDVLTGNLSGTYTVANYRISGNLTIAEDDTVYLHAGTQFLFDGPYSFNIYGTLKAIGTENDSIIFDNYGEERWRGFTLDGVTEETEFRYVRISGAEKEDDFCGGGMKFIFSNPILRHVNISNNTAINDGTGILVTDEGGGIHLEFSAPTLTDVVIANNIADYGGGIYFYHSHPVLTRVAILNNTSNENGGGLYFYNSDPILINMTIVNNVTDHSGGGMNLDYSNPKLINSIVAWNSPDNIDIYHDEEETFTYNNIGGGWEGESNIDIDPLFADSDNGDYSLQEGSPCIDAGIADIDGDGVDDITDYIGSAPDMGAFEYGTANETILGDANSDGILDILDIVLIVNMVMGNQYSEISDINEDGILNILDIVTLANIILNQ